MAALDGVAALTKQLTDLKGLDSGTALSASCREAMKVVLEAAIRTIPVSEEPHRLTKTYGSQLVNGGYARDHLKIVTKRMVDGKTSAIVSTTKRAFYVTVFEEFGTRYISARPWLVPALINNRDAVEQKFADTLATKVLALVAKNAT